MAQLLIALNTFHQGSLLQTARQTVYWLATCHACGVSFGDIQTRTSLFHEHLSPSLI